MYVGNNLTDRNLLFGGASPSYAKATAGRLPRVRVEPGIQGRRAVVNGRGGQHILHMPVIAGDVVPGSYVIAAIYSDAARAGSIKVLYENRSMCSRNEGYRNSEDYGK